MLKFYYNVACILVSLHVTWSRQARLSRAVSGAVQGRGGGEQSAGQRLAYSGALVGD